VCAAAQWPSVMRRETRAICVAGRACQGECAGVRCRPSRHASARKERSREHIRQDLDKNPANYVALSPVSFVERSARCSAIAGGDSWQALLHLARHARTCGATGGGIAGPRVARAPGQRHAAQYSEMIEAHYAVPALDACSPLNTRLDRCCSLADAACEAAVLITDREFAPVIECLRILRKQHGRAPIVIDVCDSEYAGAVNSSVRASTKRCSPA